MKMPRSCLRNTAYHMVDASLGPWMRSHGRGGRYTSSAMPDLEQLALRGDGALIRVDEERPHAAAS